MRRRMRGVAAVEFGILLIPLVMLAFGITEFGRAIYSYNTMAKSVRDAARYLTSKAPGDPLERDTAACMAVYGLPVPECIDWPDPPPIPPLVTGLTPAMVQTCDAISPCIGVQSVILTGTGTINTVTVRITGYPYNSFVEYVMPDIIFGNIAVTMRSQL
ncbi:TadE/TadG family type IV pilus assembly protein [Aromatoleum evansii]|uniref:TadE/TadG family type IV pilus assembly protein n=1 Tax=Aromatoleum evansii TaxID=59406 RepID=UPI001B7D23E3|nr:TadE family protein [Aromatoleum evansii]